MDQKTKDVLTEVWQELDYVQLQLAMCKTTLEKQKALIAGLISKKATARGPMWCDIGQDCRTYTCPCGSRLCTRYESDDLTWRWLLSHRPHTNYTMLEHVTPDVAVGPVPDRVVPFPVRKEISGGVDAEDVT